jgi:hypothetical protein
MIGSNHSRDSPLANKITLSAQLNQLITCQDFSIENGEDFAILITEHAK